MKDISLRKIFLCAKTSLIKWLLDPKMIIFAAAMLFAYNYVAIPLIGLSEELGVSLNVFESFIALGNSGMILLILPIVFMVLISDFPRIDKNTLFVISRTGKSNWLIGQLLQLVVMAALFMFVTVIVSALFVLSVSEFDTDWSYITKTYIAENPDKQNAFVSELLPENLYNQFPLTTVLLHTITLIFLYLIVLGLLFVIGALLGKKFLGVLLSGTMIVIGTILGAIKSELMWLFPMANSVTWLHYTKYLRKPIVPLSTSYLYFGIIIVLLIIVAFRLNRKAVYVDFE